MVRRGQLLWDLMAHYVGVSRGVYVLPMGPDNPYAF